jgi:hypothetical protein
VRVAGIRSPLTALAVRGEARYGPSPRVALEGGGEITWVSQQLGHSNITLTVNTCGHWARTPEKPQAERHAGASTL